MPKLTQADLERVVAQVGVAPRGIADIYPLSSLQRGLLFHTLYEPSSRVYVTTMSWRISGALNEEALESAWAYVVSRHDTLRTAFVGLELAEPLQVVLRKVTLRLRRFDWRDQGPTEQARRLQELLESERRAGFEFARPPLMRLCLIRLGEAERRLLWTSHHVLLDGWSTPVLLAEVSEAYRAYARGDSPQLAPTRPYREYIEWLQHQDLDRAQTYWRDRLCGLEGPTPLGVGRARSAATLAEADRHGEYLYEFNMELSALEKVSRRYKLTLNTLALGVWAYVLSRYSGRSDVVFGVTVSGRPPELEQADTRVGLFINTLPLRVRVDAQRSIESWLAEVQGRQNELLDYQYTPLVEVRAWGGLSPGTELFESNFVFANHPVMPQATLEPDAPEETNVADDRLRLREMQEIERAHYPLLLQFSAQGRLRVKLTYAKELFEAEAIERLAGHLQRVLEQILAAPQRRVGELQLLGRAEHERLTVEWNRTARAYPHDRCLHELFSEQATRTPGATAVVFEERSLSYGELEARSNQLAHWLIERGVGPEVVVGLCLERSLEMVIGLLGILKAGGAYLPLDPDYPPERLAFMLADTAAAAVVTSSQLVSRLPLTPPRLLLDELTEATPMASTVRPVVRVRAQNLAYVMYTSGSTGRPKGVMVSHDALMNFVTAMDDRIGLRPGEVMAAVTPLSFDIAGLEIYWPLLGGQRVVVLARAVAGDGERLKQALAANGATIMQATPASWALLLRAGWSGRKELRALCGGETLGSELAARIKKCAGSVWNLYGPTETTIWSASCELGNETTVPIGRPLANTRFYVLEESLDPVPVGVGGELYIGGAGLARGYLQRPGLTAERFVADPYGAPGERLYRTGDQARWRADGQLELLGRLDGQVKLRGHRIELGEIEAALLTHPGVSQAAVLVRDAVAGDERLVAYVTGASGTGVRPEASELRAHLQRSLPDYMIPQVFLVLESLPLTANGKLDRKALPSPAGRQTKMEYVAARTPVETTLVQVWTEVLGLDQIGVHDDFFELGGQSLLATRVAARLRELLAIELPVRALFEAPTIAGLGETVNRFMLAIGMQQAAPGPAGVAIEDGAI
jgi:amino acid adenylation domain-containing protein